MTLYPEAQKKAQQEIDLVIGNDRLPSATDYEQLPYVRALMSEVYRFHPVAPVGAFISQTRSGSSLTP
jgi:cytochrome P450